MESNWTLGRKIGLGFGVMVLIIGVISSIAYFTLHKVVEDKDRVISVNSAMLNEVDVMAGKSDELMARFQNFILTKDAHFEVEVETSQNKLLKAITTLHSYATTQQDNVFIAKAEDTFRKFVEANNSTRAFIKSGASSDQVSAKFQATVIPISRELDTLAEQFANYELQQLSLAKAASTETANNANIFIIAMGLIGFVIAALFAFFFNRLLNKQIGSAVQHIQSSSTELQAAANQQTTGTREQVTSMNEISTTVKELLATSRQIAESAQHVAHIAEDTANSARAGDLMVKKTQDSMQSIKRQVDLIVTHMLDLGKKSQQAGGILEIINELAEQTNILSINATIEAAGAGEVGKRFVVVADEIRKLADRVAGSTKDIRTLIDDIRSSVNTTIMATEGGSKAVEAGAIQFKDVTASFSQIADLVKTTTEAAREIELSTKQQSSSVEQVSSAMAMIAQTAKESETSSNQTLQTVSELTSLSRALARLVQTQTQT